MSIFRSNNPVYKRALSQAEGAIDISYEASTYAGVARKVLFYIALVVIGAVGGIALMASNPDLFVNLLILSLATTGIFAFIGFLIPSAAKFFGSIYCLGEGLLVGVVSLVFDTAAPGVVLSGAFDGRGQWRWSRLCI